MARKHTAYLIDNSYPAHTCLKQQLAKSLKIFFASPSRKKKEKKKENKN